MNKGRLVRDVIQCPTHKTSNSHTFHVFTNACVITEVKVITNEKQRNGVIKMAVLMCLRYLTCFTCSNQISVNDVRRRVCTSVQMREHV